MFVFSGIAFLKASSPVLGILVYGEQSTTFAGGEDQNSQPIKHSGEEIWTKMRIEAIKVLTVSVPCPTVDMYNLVGKLRQDASPCMTLINFRKWKDLKREDIGSSILLISNTIRGH